jgi:hypothetical protein
MISFQRISEVFTEYLNNKNTIHDNDHLTSLLNSAIQINELIWEFEDIARIKERGFESIASAKEKIDINNHLRNDLIKKIDQEIFVRENVGFIHNKSFYYSESPGMIIDRLSILFIKKHKFKKLVPLISDPKTNQEYVYKSNIVGQQIEDLGSFLDFYFNGIRNAEVCFKIYDPLKIYNDERVKALLQSI